MRRKPGTLIPLEVEILGVAVRRSLDGEPDFHGFELARVLADHEGSHRLTGHGTLYKALGRLADSGMLTSHWEDAKVALEAGRPRRRLYSITAAGEHAHAHAAAEPRQSGFAARRLGVERS